MSYIDANWVDLCSFATAVIYICIQKKRKRIVAWNHGPTLLLQLGNGLALFPLLLLFGAFFASSLASQLASASRVTMLFASVAAIVSIVNDEPAVVPDPAP